MVYYSSSGGGGGMPNYLHRIENKLGLRHSPSSLEISSPRDTKLLYTNILVPET